jgi:hypothetical protein
MRTANIVTATMENAGRKRRINIIVMEIVREDVVETLRDIVRNIIIVLTHWSDALEITVGGDKACQQCPPGKFCFCKNNKSVTKRTISNVTGASLCTECIAGKYSPTSVVSSQSVCTGCIAGRKAVGTANFAVFRIWYACFGTRISGECSPFWSTPAFF